MVTLEVGLVKALKGVPQVREHFVTRRRVVASFLRQSLSPSLDLVGCPDQGVLFGKQFTGDPGEVEFVRAEAPLVGATYAMGFLPERSYALHLAHD
jgi:hypothetical protein